MMFWLMTGVTTVLVAGFSWLDTHIITIGSQGVGSAYWRVKRMQGPCDYWVRCCGRPIFSSSVGKELN
jgi:hypothetical protein